MLFTTVFFTHVTHQKLRSIFLGARFGRIPRCENCQSDRVYKTHDTTLLESDVRLFEPEGFSEPEWPEDSVPSTVKSSGLNSPRESSTTYRCRHCWSQFRLQTGTFLEKKRLPLRLWYELAYGFAVGLSARRLQRILHLPDYRIVYGAYRTIRHALIQESHVHRRKFAGTVEVDESSYGGAFKNLRKETRRRFRLQGLAKRGRGAKVRKHGRVFSDTYTSYQGLVALGYIHRTVNHGDEEYVNGTIHINGMEGFWGLSKTNMHTYKGIRKTNWLEYLKEMEFRYNERQLSFEELAVKIIEFLCKKRRNLV